MVPLELCYDQFRPPRVPLRKMLCCWLKTVIVPFLSFRKSCSKMKKKNSVNYVCNRYCNGMYSLPYIIVRIFFTSWMFIQVRQQEKVLASKARRKFKEKEKKEIDILETELKVRFILYVCMFLYFVIFKVT